jgi:hypothetical protein
VETVQELTDKQSLLQAQLEEVGKQIEAANVAAVDETLVATEPEPPTPTPEIPAEPEVPLEQVPVPEPHLLAEVPEVETTPSEADQVPAPSSVVVPASVPSEVPSDSPVIEPNDTSGHTQSLEERIQQAVEAEVAAVLASPIIQKDLSAVETKVGQLLVGVTGTGALTLGTLVSGGSTLSLKVLVVGLGVNVAHLVLNIALGAFPKR